MKLQGGATGSIINGTIYAPGAQVYNDSKHSERRRDRIKQHRLLGRVGELQHHGKLAAHVFFGELVFGGACWA